MGEITAKLFAREGAKVVATDLQEDKLKTVVDNINTVANTTLFLASDEAAFINGSEIVIDGGYTVIK